MATSDSTSTPFQIPLTRGKVALVDEIDSDLISLKWQASKRLTTREQYTATHAFYLGNRKWNTQHMHRIIMARIVDRPLEPRELVDHINGDPLDNRRCNLRLATQSENLSNRGKQINNTSGYKGVSWHKASNAWRATIKVNQKPIHLGTFDTPEDAYRAYCDAADKLHGEFARGEWE